MDVLGGVAEGGEGVAAGAVETGDAVTGARAGAVGNATGSAEDLAGEGALFVAGEMVLSAAGAEAPD